MFPEELTMLLSVKTHIFIRMCVVYLLVIPWLLHTSQACSNCLNNACKDGRCKDGCNNGYYGRNCDSSCRTQCINRTCVLSPETGSAKCSHGCANGWHGFNCELRCSRRCHACDSFKCFRCESYNWYGPQCRRFCHRCPRKACYRNGTCMDTSHSSTTGYMLRRTTHTVISTANTSGDEDVSVFKQELQRTRSVYSLSTPAEEEIECSYVTSDEVISPSDKINDTSSLLIVGGLGSLILLSPLFIVLSFCRNRERRDRCHRRFLIRRNKVQKTEVIYDEIEFPTVDEFPRENIENGVYITPFFVPHRPLSSATEIQSQAHDLSN